MEGFVYLGGVNLQSFKKIATQFFCSKFSALRLSALFLYYKINQRSSYRWNKPFFFENMKQAEWWAMHLSMGHLANLYLAHLKWDKNPENKLETGPEQATAEEGRRRGRGRERERETRGTLISVAVERAAAPVDGFAGSRPHTGARRRSRLHIPVASPQAPGLAPSWLSPFRKSSNLGCKSLMDSCSWSPFFISDALLGIV